MKTALIIDYGAGNLKGISGLLKKFGFRLTIGNCPEDLNSSNLVVLPGVGSFGLCAKLFKQKELVTAFMNRHHDSRPILGICLGFQMMTNSSEESFFDKGLGIFNGEVERVRGKSIIGWKSIEPSIELNVDSEAFYFNHSFATYNYKGGQYNLRDLDQSYTALAIENKSVGLQFHPEKSQKAGLRLFDTLLRNVWEIN
jgi:glutamine amidotransferase